MEIAGWKLGKSLGKGGNGEVVAVERNGVNAAMKRLMRPTRKSLQRFTDEIEAMRRCSDIRGVFPVLDASVDIQNRTAWLVMPIARSLTDSLGSSATLVNVVAAVKDIAVTLRDMHARKISHRDIKPDNLFALDGGYYVGDFGLALFADKTAETTTKERIGPIHYIAPEMLNEAKDADGKPADVFSLAKTLWVLATGQRYPLPGAYTADVDAFRLDEYVVEDRTAQLDKLICAATQFDPALRPSMAAFAENLAAWLSPPGSAPRPAISINVEAFAAKLGARMAAYEARTAREQSLNERRMAVGARLRERLRPLGEEVAEALTAARFMSVHATWQNIHWGVEASGSIPSDNGVWIAIKLIIHINPALDPDIYLVARLELQRITTPSTGVMIWDKRWSFLEGSSVEDHALSELNDVVRQELGGAVTLAMTMALDPNRSKANEETYQVRVQDQQGLSISGADLVIASSEGAYLRFVSDSSGTIRTGLALPAQIAFAASRGFKSQAVLINGTEVVLSLTADAATTGVICQRGWTAIPGLLGKLSFIHDAQDRTYVYGENVVINGGAVHPVHFVLGDTLRLVGTDGREASATVCAIHGSCFLLDVTS
ncbi:serine/threonine protein kinase [Variovorax sp. Root411]|uniref:serine/threonine protein kinase n=1 Tax=Variovorax sp. Root411 TaxID=1736530 RepID=UPI0009E741DD|nr:protein kinase [Variovorax sp. Root411]